MPQRAFTDRPGHKCDKCGSVYSFIQSKITKAVICNECKNKLA